LLQVDCVTPFYGTEQDLIDEVCNHLNSIDPIIEVKYNFTQNISNEIINNNELVLFFVIQIQVSQR